MSDRLEMLDRLKRIMDVSELLSTDESVLRNMELTSKQASRMFNIPEGTLRGWRRIWFYDKRYPRFHKRITGKVYYLLGEVIEDMEKMNMPMKAGIM